MRVFSSFSKVGFLFSVIAMSSKKTQPSFLDKPNPSRFNTKNFLKFMQSPNSIGQILEEYNWINKHQPVESDERSSGILQCLTNTIAHNSTSYDVIKYRCTKHPTKDNLNEFWRTASDQNSDIIVVLTTHNEITFQYWSSEENHEVECNSIVIRTIKVLKMDCYNMSLLQLKEKGKATRQVVLFHYTAWPSDNVSHNSMRFIKFIDTVNDIQTIGPIIVQCSDGKNKSGVFCLLDICIADLKKGKGVFVSKALQRIRQVNQSSISLAENYVFCYNALYHCVLNNIG